MMSNMIAALLRALVVMVFFLSGCRQDNVNYDTELLEVLKLSKSNRPELEKVLSHYSHPEDSLKYKASVFLIKYMPGKYAKVFTNYEDYQAVFDSLEILNQHYERIARTPEYYKFYKQTFVSHFFPKNLLVNRGGSSHFTIKEDIHTITKAYLIENIDYAFKAWEKPWARHLNFQEFCEYLLPYRYGHEELQPWRKSYYQSSIHYLDPVKTENDPVKVGLLLNRIGEKSFSEVLKLGELTNAIRSLDLIRINTSTSCKDQSGLGLLKMRALGVPVARLTTQCWGNAGSGHDFNGILNLKKKWIGFQNGEFGSGIYQIPAIYQPATIHAEIYSRNRNSSFIGYSDIYEVNPYYVDVTGDIAQVSSLMIPFKNSAKLAVLCVFNNAKWVPVVKSTIEDGKAIFPQMGRKVIYLAGTLNAGKLELHDDPFLLDSNGIIKPINATKKNQVLTLYRKYPHKPSIINKLSGLQNAEFQGSNDERFASSVKLLEIGELLDMHTITQKLNKAKYKYVRFVFPATATINESLAGIHVYGGNDTQLKGEPISSLPTSAPFFKNVFDDDMLTYVRILNQNFADFPQFYEGNSLVISDKQPFWIGLKFKEETEITRLSITPRTDDNGINNDEFYELYYWDKGNWMSAGQKQGTGHKVIFTAPGNALYLLKNINKGKEHRIFLYENKQQVWF